MRVRWRARVIPLLVADFVGTSHPTIPHYRALTSCPIPKSKCPNLHRLSSPEIYAGLLIFSVNVTGRLPVTPPVQEDRLGSSSQNLSHSAWSFQTHRTLPTSCGAFRVSEADCLSAEACETPHTWYIPAPRWFHFQKGLICCFLNRIPSRQSAQAAPAIMSRVA